MADREVALPAGVARVGRRQPLADFQTRPVGGQRGASGPPAPSTSPSLFWLTDRSRCQPALPGSAAASRCADFQTRPVGGQRGRQVPLRAEHVAQFVMADRQVALPAGVARVGRRQPLR